MDRQKQFFYFNEMNQNEYLEWLIPLPEGEERDILMAQLGQLGIEAFAEEADHFTACGPYTQVETDEITQLLLAFGWDIAPRLVVQQNWNAQWEASFEPVRVANFAAVRASFHAPVTDVAHEIIITPKMSFGTGHHATTWLCIQALASFNLRGKSVIDFGTGTGVLAILAENMGAGPIVAIDNDEWSIANASENIKQNGCEAITLKFADQLEGLKRSDLILANINRHILLANMDAMSNLLNPGGVLVMSGILADDEAIITGAAIHAGLKARQVFQRAGWLCLIFAVPSSNVN
jgi:ribosomal protein L11 methyltransferase